MTERFPRESIDERVALIDRAVDVLQKAQLEQHLTPTAARLRLDQFDRQLAQEGYSESDRDDVLRTAADLIKVGDETELEFELRRMLYE